MAAKIVISGGPHTGKTTLFEALKCKYGDEVTYIEEPATTVIKTLGNIAIINKPEEFCNLCIEVSKRQEDLASEKGQLVIQDRSLIDTVAYARRDGCEVLIPGLLNLIQAADYTSVLFCEPVGDYKSTDVRYEDQETAMRTHEMLFGAYRETGIPIVHIPAMPTNTRVDLVSQLITSNTWQS